MDKVPETIRRLHRTVSQLAKAVHPFPLGMVLWDRNGIVTPRTKGKNRGNWGTGSIGQERRLGPGMLEKAYRQLPKDMLAKFVLLSADPEQPTPSKQEYARFERRLLESVRRVLNQELKERIRRLPQPVGMRERKVERTRLIVSTFRTYKAKQWTNTVAAKQTASDLGIDRATVWRHLASTKGH